MRIGLSMSQRQALTSLNNVNVVISSTRAALIKPSGEQTKQLDSIVGNSSHELRVIVKTQAAVARCLPPWLNKLGS
jgi:hypothetical protein